MPTKTPLKTKLGFGAGEFSSSIFFTITSFWLMIFLTDEVRLTPALAGVALLVGKIWDSLIDPLIGYISDRTKTRWGRRRPYFLWFGIPFGFAFMLMFNNPGIDSQSGKFIWTLLTYIFFCTAYSLTNIPYNALLPELSKDYDERTNISGYKQAFAVLGTLIGAGIAQPVMNLFPDRTSGFVGMGALFGLLATISILVPFFSLREAPIVNLPKKENIIKTLKEVFVNRPFVMVLISWITNTTGVAMIMAMLVYFYKYVFQKEEAVTMAMIVTLVVAMGFIPVWVKISNKIGKKSAYMIGMVIAAASVVVVAFAGDFLGANGILGILVFSGIGFSAHYVLPWSLIPDTIDYDYAQSGVRREGIYYSIWTFFIAVGGALAGFFIGIGLDLFGYVPDVVQSASSVLGMRILFGPIPALFFILGNVAVKYYSLDKEKYQEIQKIVKDLDSQVAESLARVDKI